jgi:hypothetical protein
MNERTNNQNNNDRNTRPVTCADFDLDVDELALGLIAEPRRSALLDHSGSCAVCQANLDAATALGDRLMLLTPDAEPPAGFESRVLARLGTESPSQRRPARLRWLVAAAVVALALLAGTLVGWVSRGTTVHEAGVVKHGVIASSTGAEVGTIQLISAPQPHVLVSIGTPRAGPGVRHCELVLRDGRRIDVGSWSYDEIRTGVWAAGIDKALLDAVSMRIVDEATGAVVATANLH